MLLHTLHHAGEIRTPDMIEDLPTAPLEQVILARRVIDALEEERHLNLAAFTDQLPQVDVRRLIDAKIAGEEIVEPAPIDTPPVLHLRDALTQSLLAVSAQKKMPAKATTAAPERKRA